MSFWVSRGAPGALLGALGSLWGAMGAPRGSLKSKKLVFLVTVVNFKGPAWGPWGRQGAAKEQPKEQKACFPCNCR